MPTDDPPAVAVLLYPGCIFFEIAWCTETLARAGARLRFHTPDGQPHLASNGARLLADGGYDDIARQRWAAVLIPGGDPGSIIPDHRADDALRRAAADGAVMAGICAGALVLAAAGLLRGVRATHNYTAEWASPEAVAFTAPFWEGLSYERADVVEDGPFITAQPWADRAFAAAVARRLGLAAPG